MRTRLQRICEATQRCPVGLASVMLSAVCGFTYLATVLIPLFLRRENILRALGEGLEDWVMAAMIVGSGVSILLALLSFGLERPVWPAAASLSVLVITENLVLPVMPFWTLMLLGAWSAWAVLACIAAGMLAVALIVRRVVTGKVVIESFPQFGRCPLLGR